MPIPDETILDARQHPEYRRVTNLILTCHYRTPQFRERAERLGWWSLLDNGRYGAVATPELAEATRRLLGKGLLVTKAASDWYRQATTC